MQEQCIISEQCTLAEHFPYAGLVLVSGQHTKPEERTMPEATAL